MKQVDKNEQTSSEVRTARRRTPSRSELQRTMTELLEQQVAISEVLRAIADSPHDLQPIFDTILAKATHLCRADLGALLLFEEEDFRVVARKSQVNVSPQGLPVQGRLGHRSGTPLARLAKYRSPIHIEDLTADQAYLDRSPGVVFLVESTGVRTSLLVPMIKEDVLIGAINILRVEVRPFTERQIKLIRDFATGATIVLESTRRERQYREGQIQLAHTNRIATMGQLTASIAHEVNQPIAATVTNAHAALRWLTSQPPNLEEVEKTLARIIKDGDRAGDVIGRIRELGKKAPLQKQPLEINEVIKEVIELTRGEVVKNGISMRTELAGGLPPVLGDRVQLQQVMLNLIINAIQAMSEFPESIQELHISTENTESEGVRVAVRDFGPGLSGQNLERLFEPFHTTKANGLGMGLSICRSIIEMHGGRLWAEANAPRGAVFQFTVPDNQHITT